MGPPQGISACCVETAGLPCVGRSHDVTVQGEAFGCPYKTLSPHELTETLRGMRVGPRTVEEAVGKAKGHHYQLACTAVFQGQHNCICESAISHPNQVRQMIHCCVSSMHKEGGNLLTPYERYTHS